MPKLISSENEAASLAGHGLPIETAADPARSALAQPSAVLVLPARDSDHALVATIRTADARRAEQTGGGRKVAAYEATGFLGLDDAVVYEDEQPKPWWKRLFGM